MDIDYLWFNDGEVLTASGRVLDTASSLDDAARSYAWPVVFRIGCP